MVKLYIIYLYKNHIWCRDIEYKNIKIFWSTMVNMFILKIIE